jgi:hypothetical protein
MADDWTRLEHVEAEDPKEDYRSWSDLLIGHIAYSLEKLHALAG